MKIYKLLGKKWDDMKEEIVYKVMIRNDGRKVSIYFLSFQVNIMDK
jgi:hypothetical protein